MVDDDDNNDDAGAWVYYKLTYEPLAQASKKATKSGVEYTFYGNYRVITEKFPAAIYCIFAAWKSK